MRVNVYAEEMTDRVQIISKEIEGQRFTGLRFYLELPVTVRAEEVCPTCKGEGRVTPDSPPKTCMTCNGRGRLGPVEKRGPFLHHMGDDDSAAVTFWGKQDLRVVLRKALEMLDEHYANAPSGGGR